MSLLSNIKLKLWITDTTQDSLLNLLLSESEALINRLCDVDSFRQAEYTVSEKHNHKGIYTLRNYPITDVMEVNGEEDFWPFFVAFERTVFFSDKPEALEDFDFVTIKYEAGYATLPADLNNLIVLGAIGMYNKRKNVWIIEYRLGEETIKFWNDEDMIGFDNLLSAYKKVNVIS
jgi:hypothetical protein